MSRQTRKRRSTEQWQVLIAEQAQCGLSQRAFSTGAWTCQSQAPCSRRPATPCREGRHWKCSCPSRTCRSITMASTPTPVWSTHTLISKTIDKQEIVAKQQRDFGAGWVI